MKKINNKKDIRVNVDYVEFISILKNDKLDINIKNIEKIESLYNEVVKWKFSNVKRIFERNLRVENVSKLNSVLVEYNLSLEEFKSISNKVLLLNNNSIYKRRYI